MDIGNYDVAMEHFKVGRVIKMEEIIMVIGLS